MPYTSATQQARAALRGCARTGYRVANRVLHKIGFKLVRVERPTRTFDEFFQHLKNLGFYPGTVIEVGAASGTDSLHAAFPEAKFILIEPLEEFREPLRRFAERHDCEAHFAAAGSREGEVEIRIAPDLYGSSVARTSDAGDRKVPVITLDRVLERTSPAPPILLKIDVQGYEPHVMEGIRQHLSWCEVVIIEASTYCVSEDPPDFYTVVSYMKERGLSVYDFLDGIPRPYDNALGQVDLVFVQDDGRFRQYRGWR